MAKWTRTRRKKLQDITDKPITFNLTTDQDAFIRALALKRNETIAEVLRDAVDLMRQQKDLGIPMPSEEPEVTDVG